MTDIIDLSAYRRQRRLVQLNAAGHSIVARFGIGTAIIVFLLGLFVAKAPIFRTPPAARLERSAAVELPLRFMAAPSADYGSPQTGSASPVLRQRLAQ